MQARARTVMGFAAALTVFLVGAAGAAAAQGDAPRPEPLTGRLTVDQDLRVEPGETLALGPNTTLDGAGRVLVYGTLLAEGAEGQPVAFNVPVYFFDSAASRMNHVTFAGASGFNVLVERGDLAIRNAAFDGDGRAIAGIKVLPQSGRADVTVESASFRDYRAAGLDVTGPGSVTVRDASFHGNGIGVLAALPRAGALNVDVSESRFEGQTRDHVVVDADGGAEVPSTVTLTRNQFAPMAPQATSPSDASSAGGVAVEDFGAQAALRVIGETPAASPDARRADIVTSGNTFTGTPTGIHLTGGVPPASFRLLSTGDVFDGNGVGVYARLAGADIEAATFTGSRLFDVFVPYAPDVIAPLVALHNSSYDVTSIGVDPGAGAVATDTGLIAGGTIAAAAGAVGVAGALGFALSHTARTAFVSTVFVPFYTRIRRGEVLAHGTRKDILEFVTSNPGTHMRRIGHVLGLSYGALTYHVYRLQKEGFLTSKEEGLFKRFYPVGAGKAATPDAPPTPSSLRPAEQDILKAVAADPGRAQSAIAEHLGLSRQALHYHVKKLATRGFLTKVAQGRETLLFASDDVKRAFGTGPEAHAAVPGGPAADATASHQGEDKAAAGSHD